MQTGWENKRRKIMLSINFMHFGLASIMEKTKPAQCFPAAISVIITILTFCSKQYRCLCFPTSEKPGNWGVGDSTSPRGEVSAPRGSPASKDHFLNMFSMLLRPCLSLCF